MGELGSVLAQGAGSGGDGGGIAAAAAEDPGATDGDAGAGQRADDIDPVGGPVAADQRGPERAGGVHRGAADRRRPQPGERDVAAHPERTDRPDVLRRRGGAEDHADEHSGERDLHQQRLPVLVARAGQRGAKVLDVAEHREQEQAGQRRADELGDDVTGHATPREVATHRERERDAGVQVRARDRAHEQDDGHHHQPGRDDGGRQADLALGVQQPPAGSDEHEHERAQDLGEQPAVLEAGIFELGP